MHRLIKVVFAVLILVIVLFEYSPQLSMGAPIGGGFGDPFTDPELGIVPPPTALVAMPSACGSNHLKLSWRPDSSHVVFHIYAKINNGDFAKIGETSNTDFGYFGTPGDKLTFKIEGQTNKFEYSDFSAEVSQNVPLTNQIDCDNNPPIMPTYTAGSLNLTANSCFIKEGESTCRATNFELNGNLYGYYDLYNTKTNISTFAFYPNTYQYLGTDIQTVTANLIDYGSTELKVRSFLSPGIDLAILTLTASCQSGLSWDGGKCAIPSSPSTVSGSFLRQLEGLYEQISALQAILDSRKRSTADTATSTKFNTATVVLITKTPDFTNNKTMVEVKYSGISEVRRFTVFSTDNTTVLNKIASVLNIGIAEAQAKLSIGSQEQVGISKIEVTFKINKKEEADLNVTYKDGSVKLFQTTKADEQEIIDMMYGGNEELFVKERDAYFEEAKTGKVDPVLHQIIANILRVKLADVSGIVTVKVDETSYAPESGGG